MPPADSEVHVYSASLQTTPERIEHFHAILSPDEKAQAAAFRFPERQTAHIVSHGLLRTILASYLNTHPAKIAFERNPWGKPAIPGAGLFFNMSHSGDLALYAVAREPQLGIDVEWIRPVPDHAAIAERFFSEAEAGDVLGTPADERLQAFYRCWTRKEAYIKALGMGLSAPLKTFRVSILPDHPPRFLSIEGDSERATQWSLFELTPAPGYIGALAISGTGWRLCHRKIG